MTPPPARKSVTRTLLSLVLLVLVPGLSGCMTSRLWGWDVEEQGPREQTVLASEDEQVVPGTLRVTGPGLRFEQADGERAWRLAPRDDGEIALALLDHPDLVEIGGIRLTRSRIEFEGRLVHDEAELELSVSLVPEAVGARAEPPPAVWEVLEDRVSGRDSTLPPVHRQCQARVTAEELRWVLGLGDEPVVVGASVFADRGGGVYAAEGSTISTLGQDLTALGATTLWVRVLIGDESACVRLQPDALWLATSCAQRTDLRHVSRWRVETAPAYAVEASHAPRLMGSAATMLMLTASYERHVVQPIGAGLTFWEKIALTPLTVAFDISAGLLGAALEQLFGELVSGRCDDDDDDDGGQVRVPMGSKQQERARRRWERETGWRSN